MDAIENCARVHDKDGFCEVPLTRPSTPISATPSSASLTSDVIEEKGSSPLDERVVVTAFSVLDSLRRLHFSRKEDGVSPLTIKVKTI